MIIFPNAKCKTLIINNVLKYQRNKREFWILNCQTLFFSFLKNKGKIYYCLLIISALWYNIS